MTYFADRLDNASSGEEFGVILGDFMGFLAELRDRDEESE